MGLFHSRRRQVYATLGEGGLELESVGNAKLGEKLGEGVSCVVYGARWEDRDVALKLYKAGSIERHARLLGGELVEFEYRRNRAFFEASGLGRYVAEPLAYLSTAGLSALVQERLDGRLYYDLYREGTIGDEAFEHIREIVRLAHAAELFDVDLHAGNFLVVREPSGELIPKMFDFNFIPFYLHPPNPAVWLGVQLRILDRAWRDRRKLKAFHDFTRMDRKRELFGKE